MMTARNRVGPLPTHRLVVRHSVDCSSSDHFSLDDSLRDSSSSSSSETSSDSSTDALSDSASSLPSIPRSSTAISDRPSQDSSSTSPSRKRSRPPTVSVPLSSPTLGALSYARADLLPSPKRIRILTQIQDRYHECIAYADALRARGIDARVVVEAVDREEIETSARGPVKGHRIIATGQQSADMLERIRELERDNMRLRDIMDVASQRVARSQRRELLVQREMRQIRRFRFYDRMRIARLEAYARRHLGYRS
ncbi:hypothetical protein Tco_0161594 [Tanacetum coccineum]